MSTHQLSVAEEMADRIGIIHGGKLIAVGTRDELRKLSGTSGPLEDIFLALTAEWKMMSPLKTLAFAAVEFLTMRQVDALLSASNY